MEEESIRQHQSEKSMVQKTDTTQQSNKRNKIKIANKAKEWTPLEFCWVSAENELIKENHSGSDNFDKHCQKITKYSTFGVQQAYHWGITLKNLSDISSPKRCILVLQQS